MVRPELMTAESAKDGQQFRDRGRSSGRVGVARVADNAQDTVFGQRASGPGTPTGCGKPIVRAIMLHMGGVDEGDEDIDVK